MQTEERTEDNLVVYRGDGALLGEVQGRDGDLIFVGDEAIPVEVVERVAGRNIFLKPHSGQGDTVQAADASAAPLACAPENTLLGSDERYERARADFRAHHQASTNAADEDFAIAEPRYRSGYRAGGDTRYAARSFEEIEPELRREFGATSADDGWERLRERVRLGFAWARER